MLIPIVLTSYLEENKFTIIENRFYHRCLLFYESRVPCFTLLTNMINAGL